VQHTLYAQIGDERKSEEDIKIEDAFVATKLLSTSGKKKEAIKMLDSLRRITAPSAAIYFELAKLHYELKDINLTESNLKQAIKYEPDNTWIRRFEVSFSLDLGRKESAIQTIQHLITLQPKISENYQQIIQLYLADGNFDKALEYNELKLQNEGWSSQTLLKKAEILDMAGRLSESLSVIVSLADKYPNEVKYYKLIVNLLHSNDKIQESGPYLQKILDIDRNDNDAKLGLLMLKKGKITDDDLMVAIMPLINNRDVPIDIKVKELLVYVHKQTETGDTLLKSQLLKLCDQLVITHPNEAKAHAIYADVLKNNENYTAAIRQYEKTLQFNDKIFSVWEQYMFCLLVTEQYDKLATTADNAIDFFPNQAISYYFKAKAFVILENLKKAESYLDEAEMISAGSPDIMSRVYTVRSEILYNKKDFAKALIQVDAAIKTSNGNNTDALELKGDILKVSNDMKSAASYWQKAYDLGKRSPQLIKKLDLLKSN